MKRAPLVSILITAHDRPEELRQTLRLLRRQQYPALELLVIDDASNESLQPVVAAEWPNARFWRNEHNLGLIPSRSLGMTRARGEYMLTLDDDSAPVDPAAIARLIERFGDEPELGLITCDIHEGTAPPPLRAQNPPERYVQSFTGCANMMRREMMRSLGGYRDYFVYYGEESEYALRAFDRGWRILFLPAVVIHHRMSSIGRSDARITAYNFRNSLWTVLLDVPFPRLAVELVWKVSVNGAELVKQGSLRWAAWAVGSFTRGLPRVLGDRRPVSPNALRVYDVVRFRTVRSAAMLADGTSPSLAERVRWLRTVWRNRRRAAAFWNRSRAAIGRLAWAPAPKTPAGPVTSPRDQSLP